MPVVQRPMQTQATDALPGARRQAAENDISAGVGLAEQDARTDLAASNTFGTIASVSTQAIKEQRVAADKEKERADQIAVMNAGNLLSQWENQRLYDPNSGALTVKGKDAFGLPEKVGDEYNDVASQVEQTLGTDKQREAFARIKIERQQNIDLTLRRHVYGEMQRYEGQELSAFVENAKSSAIANAGDPRRVGVEIGRAVDAIRLHAPRLGLGPEEVTQQVEAATSATHVGVIENLLAQDKSRAASVYFDETKSQIKGEALAHIEKALEEGKNRGEAQKQTDAITGDGGTLSEQLEKARKIDDPKLRDEVTARLEHNDAIKERAQREQEATTLRGVYDTLDKTGDVTKIPPAVWAGMDGGQRSAARSYADKLTRGVAVETDFPTYYGLMQKAAHDPESFATENLLNYRAKIGDTELKQLTEMQGSIVKGDRAKADAQLGQFRTNEELVNSTLPAYGIDPKAKPTSTEGKAIGELYRMLGTRVSAQEHLTGKKPTNDDVQRTLDQILSEKATVPGSWFGSFWPTEKPIISITNADIPAKDKALITDALTRKGRPVSDATILDVYLEQLARAKKK